MSDRILEIISVFNKVVQQARTVPVEELDVKNLRRQAAREEADSRGIRIQTVEDKYGRQLQPQIAKVADFDAAIEGWLLHGSLSLHDTLLAHAVDKADRELIAAAFSTPPRSVPADEELDNEFGENVFDDHGVEEGRKRLREHWARERNRKVVAQAKKLWAARERGLCCDVCGFDFELIYGEHGADYIEAHHVDPLHHSDGVRTTRVEDLAPLCSNCHRMIHKTKPMPEIGDMKAAVRARLAEKEIAWPWRA